MPGARAEQHDNRKAGRAHGRIAARRDEQCPVGSGGRTVALMEVSDASVVFGLAGDGEMRSSIGARPRQRPMPDRHVAALPRNRPRPPSRRPLHIDHPQVGLGHAPQHLPFGAGQDAGNEQGSCSTIDRAAGATRDLVQGAERKTAAGRRLSSDATPNGRISFGPRSFASMRAIWARSAASVGRGPTSVMRAAWLGGGGLCSLFVLHRWRESVGRSGGRTPRRRSGRETCEESSREPPVGHVRNICSNRGR